MKHLYIFFYLFLCLCLNIMANNIQISNLSITDQNYSQHYCLVKFDMSWENSWRSTSAPPFNWDAAWVFIKYKNLTGEWHHATLNNSGHIEPDSVTITSSGDNKGVFVYRSSDGSGNVTWQNIKLRWNYGIDNVPDDASLEISVFAIEMVYVTEGNFYIGDGNGSGQSTWAFYLATNYFRPALISAEKTVVKVEGWNSWDSYTYIWSGIGIDGDNGIDTIPTDQTIDNPYYPTGYKAFYAMKYEISQEQYRDFLNSLTRTQQNRRVWTNISASNTDSVYVMSNRIVPCCNQSLYIQPTFSPYTPVQFYCELNKVSTNPPSFDPDSIDDGQTFACNFLTWMDGAAYSDWAGLRPMTELEYEKACRGPNPAVTYEYAWGTTALYQSYVPMPSNYTYNHQNRGWYDEIITNPGINTGNAKYINTGSEGPLRCGEIAASAVNHSKIETGSSYYGIMEMTGNLLEMVVHLCNQAGQSFTGLHGNGELNQAGDADVDFWPGIGGNNNVRVPNTIYSGTGVTGAGGSGSRGGSFGHDQMALRVSSRLSAGDFQTNHSHESTNGFRCVRSAPNQ